jgi:hypothetical protein
MKVHRYFEQIKAIVASPLVGQYLVGITTNVQNRRSAYERVGFLYFFVLEVGLNRSAAISLERGLFDALTSDPDLSSKYHAEKRGGSYRASTGGKIGETYALYVAALAP